MSEFVTIATFNFTYEITVLKSILENEKIPYFFKNENSVTIHPYASYAYGGIDLQVHPNDIEKVKEIIGNLNTNLEIV